MYMCCTGACELAVNCELPHPVLKFSVGLFFESNGFMEPNLAVVVFSVVHFVFQSQN